MKPKPLSNQTTAFVLIGHAFGLAFALGAFHLSAEGLRAWDFGEPFSTLGRFILDADTVLQVRWPLVLSIAALAIWFDRKLVLRLTKLQMLRAVRAWAYMILLVTLLLAGVSVGCFRHWVWMMEEPFGSVG